MGPRLGKLILQMSSGRGKSNGIEMDGNNDEENQKYVAQEFSTDKENNPKCATEQRQQCVDGKYKSVDLQQLHEIAGSSTSSQSNGSQETSSGANDQPCTSSSLALSSSLSKLSIGENKLALVEKSAKKRRTFKSSTSGKRDFFGMRRSKKWPMMRLSTCCTKKDSDVEPPPSGSLSCICTGYRRKSSENEPDLPEPSVNRAATISNQAQFRHNGGFVPIIDLSLFNPADYPIDDEDERMRRQRAKEMAEGVELSSRFGVLSLKRDSYQHVHTQVDYIHCLVPDLKEISTCSFYWGKIDRYEAEKLLDGKPEGTFLLRDSAQEEYLFSVSFRRYGRSLHARIEQWNYSFSFDSHDPSVFSSPTVTGLIEHYKDPSSCMFFEPLLTTPLHRNFPFDLQHLARSVICSKINYDDVNSLPLPKKLKVYCKEYHYKQRVRVRQLD